MRKVRSAGAWISKERLAAPESCEMSGLDRKFGLAPTVDFQAVSLPIIYL